MAKIKRLKLTNWYMAVPWGTQNHLCRLKRLDAYHSKYNCDFCCLFWLFLSPSNFPTGYSQYRLITRGARKQTSLLTCQFLAILAKIVYQSFLINVHLPSGAQSKDILKLEKILSMAYFELCRRAEELPCQKWSFETTVVSKQPLRSDLISNLKFMSQTTYATMFVWPVLDKSLRRRRKLTSTRVVLSSPQAITHKDETGGRQILQGM